MKKNTYNNTWFYFPEKINSVALFFIVLLMIVSGFTIAALTKPQKNYQYLPNYKEMMYSDKVNAYIRYFCNYEISSEDNTLKKTENVYMTYGKVLSSATGKKTVSVIYVTESNELDYSFHEITSNNHYLKNSTSFAGGGLKSLYVNDVIYVEEEESINKVVLSFKEDMITLTKKEINQNECDQFSNNEIFSAFKITIREHLDSKNKVDKYSIDTTLRVSTENISKYHLDYNSFIIDSDNKAYPLLGLYNISSLATFSTSTTQVTSSWTWKYIIVKANFTDEFGNTKTLYYKKPFSTF